MSYRWLLISTCILHIVCISILYPFFSSPILPSSQADKVTSSLSISSCHDQDLTPSAAYTKYSMCRVQRTPSTASTQDWLPSLHSPDYKFTLAWSFSYQRASLHDWPPSASSPWQLKGEVTLSHSHSCDLPNWWRESQYPAHRTSTTSNSSSNYSWSRPPSASPKSPDYSLQV